MVISVVVAVVEIKYLCGQQNAFLSITQMKTGTFEKTFSRGTSPAARDR